MGGEDFLFYQSKTIFGEKPKSIVLIVLGFLYLDSPGLPGVVTHAIFRELIKSGEQKMGGKKKTMT